MKVSLPGLLGRRPGPDGYGMSELCDNLRELRDRYHAGDAASALDEFFGIYVFADGKDRESTARQSHREPASHE